MANIEKHTSPDQRESMHFSLLPGRNTYDFEAIQKIGISSRNLLTFILGDDPKAVAEYIRNCRTYGVSERKIGKISDVLPTIQRPIEGLYWDYFSQLCPSVIKDTMCVPLPENSGPIPMGINLMKGREHDSTKKAMQEFIIRKKLSGIMAGTARSIAQISHMHFGKLDPDAKKLADDIEVREVRDPVAQTALFAKAGTANTKNWIMEDEARRLIDQYFEINGDPRRYDDLTDVEKYTQFETLMGVVLSACGLLQEEMEGQGEIFACFPILANGTFFGSVNRPIVLAKEMPKNYISPDKKRPFISYFGVVETKRNHYLQHVEAMKFLLDVMHHMLPSVYAHCSEIRAGVKDPKQRCLGDLKTVGSGSKKEVIFTDNKTRIASINADKLREASFELLISNFKGARNRDKIDPHTIKKVLLDSKKISDFEDFVEQENLLPKNWRQDRTIRHADDKVNRNDPCPCGSGHKFKKCCLKH